MESRFHTSHWGSVQLSMYRLQFKHRTAFPEVSTDREASGRRYHNERSCTDQRKSFIPMHRSSIEKYKSTLPNSSFFTWTERLVHNPPGRTQQTLFGSPPSSSATISARPARTRRRGLEPLLVEELVVAPAAVCDGTGRFLHLARTWKL